MDTDGSLQEAAAVNAAPQSTPVLCKKGSTVACPEAEGPARQPPHRTAGPTASPSSSHCVALQRRLTSTALTLHLLLSSPLFVKDRRRGTEQRLEEKVSNRCGKRKEKRGRTPTAMCSFLLVLVGRHGLFLSRSGGK
jgi:hypothetical protein